MLFRSTQFKKLSVQIDSSRKELSSIEGLDLFDAAAHAKSKAALNEALIREEIFWRQKSRVAWLKEGDRATKFFMASTVTRRRRNFIQTLKIEQGTELDQVSDIAKMFIEKFSRSIPGQGNEWDSNGGRNNSRSLVNGGG